MGKKISNDISHRISYHYDEEKDMWIPCSYTTSTEDIMFSNNITLSDQLTIINNCETDIKTRIALEISENFKHVSATDSWDTIIETLESIAQSVESMYVFEYTGAVQTFTAPITGTYEIKCAGGGSGSGKGSYMSSQVVLTKGTELFVYVGGQHSPFNGGGGNASFSGDNGLRGTTSYGSGATDVRLIKSTDSNGWSGETSLKSRLITAGGGGGYGSSNKYGKYYVIEDYNGYDNAVSKWYSSSDYEGASSYSSEFSNGILGSGSGSSMSQSHGINRAYCQYCDTTHETDFYYVNKKLAGGGGWYGGKNGYAGTSYANSDYTYNGVTYVLTNTIHNPCVNTSNGYVNISLIG